MNNGNGNVAGDAVVQKAGRLINTRSKFDLTYPFFTTNRFGEITPFFWMDNVDGDHNNKCYSSSKVDSYTLKAPLMQDIKMKKAFYFVPRQALLPRNWEKFYVNPNIGDDVPDDVGTSVQSFWLEVYTAIKALYDDLCDGYAALDDIVDEAEKSIATRDLFTGWLKWVILAEMFYSDGNLLKQLGVTGSKYLHVSGDHYFNDNGQSHRFDEYFDLAFSALAQANSVFTVIRNADNIPYVVSPTGDASTDDIGWSLSYRELLDFLRDDIHSFRVAYADESSSADVMSYATFFDYIFDPILSDSSTVDDHLDCARILSYQMICHHFYSNDHVDYIYSADLYRQYMEDLYYCCKGSLASFSYNGLTVYYDALSARNIRDCLVSSADFAELYAQSYIQNIFSFRHSLRYVDYFVGGRTRPLAVGDTDVDVNNSKASVIDITQKIMAQKFLNALNRVGRKIGDYSHIMGGDGMKPDFHNPLYIGMTSDTIYGDRSEYTGNVNSAEQNNVTSLLKNAGGKYLFSWENDRPGICLGLCYYDIERIYTQFTERQAFYLNRFDMYNPYQQFIGDQAIYQSELMTGGKQPFGYANRHIEYKIRVPQAAGGFVSDSGLPSWIFSAERGFRRYEANISPTFIRSFNSEFDQFYVSLTGYSLGTYFHFIVRHLNMCSSSRPMAVAPDILQ